MTRALLVAAYKKPAAKVVCEEHLEELAELARTYGAEVVGRVTCHARKVEAATYITSGKVLEVQNLAEAEDADVVIFDEEIAPSQQRNLEKAFGRAVIDRTELILGVFEEHAKTKEARLQVELAEVKYQLPRLKRLWTHLSRQAGTGAGGYLKGEGEKQIEIDKRLMQKKIDRLQAEIEEVRHHRETQRRARKRSGIPVLAIVGYTNAGKSTLMNALTNAGVLVEDQLFATLDTTTRKYTLPNNQEVLFIDTVGFIRKLPHLLVAAFKSTLEEAVHADILVHLIDASHPMAEEQVDASLAVLEELGAAGKPTVTVLNKIDKVVDNERLNRLQLKFPRTVLVSAATGEGLQDLLVALEEELRRQRRQVTLRIPQKDYGVVSRVMEESQVLSSEYEGNDVVLRVELPAALAGKLKEYIEDLH